MFQILLGVVHDGQKLVGSLRHAFKLYEGPEQAFKRFHGKCILKEVRRTLREVRAVLSDRSGKRDVGKVYRMIEEVAPKREIREGEEYFIKSLGVSGKVVKVDGDRVKVKVRNFVLDVRAEDLM